MFISNGNTEWNPEPAYETLQVVPYESGTRSRLAYEITEGELSKDGDVVIILDGNNGDDEMMNSLRVARSNPGDISICFNGGLAERKILTNSHCKETLLEIIERIKSINVCSHSERGDSNPLCFDNTLVGMFSVFAMEELFKGVKGGLKELTFMRYTANEDVCVRLSQSFCYLCNLEYLRLSYMIFPDNGLAKMIEKMQGKMPNLRYLSIRGNHISTYAANGLSAFIGEHKRMVYLDIAHCEMGLYELDKILDGCEMNGQMQVLDVGRTISATAEGKRTIEHRMMSGRLRLLDIAFHQNDRVQAFKRRIKKYTKQNYEERIYIDKMQRNKKIDPNEIPDALSAIAGSPDGVNNAYICIRGDLGDTLKTIAKTNNQKGPRYFCWEGCSGHKSKLSIRCDSCSGIFGCYYGVKSKRYCVKCAETMWR